MTQQKVAVISGATGGIGSVIGTHLAEQDWRTIGVTRNVRSPIPPGYTSMIQCDVTHASMVEHAARTIHETAHRCDALIIAHGHAPITTPSVLLRPEDFSDILRTDVLGAFRLAQAFGTIMLRQGHGAIVFISSLHAHQTYPARSGYAAAKAGVCGMMRSLALEWGPYGLRINAILPWQTEGTRTQAMIETAQERGEDLREAYLARSPTRRLVDPEDIARTVSWLLSTPSVHGAEIMLDAGVSASMWYQGYTDHTKGEPHVQ